MSAHTPGPWHYREGSRIVVDGGGWWIAEVQAGRADNSSEANARLIAAAPDLLAALENYVRVYGPLPVKRVDCVVVYDAAKTLIAKVRG